MRLPIPEEVLHSKFHMDITKIATCSLGTDNNRQQQQTTGGGVLEKFTMTKTRKKEMISQNLIPKSLRDLDKLLIFNTMWQGGYICWQDPTLPQC